MQETVGEVVGKGCGAFLYMYQQSCIMSGSASVGKM